MLDGLLLSGLKHNFRFHRSDISVNTSTNHSQVENITTSNLKKEVGKVFTGKKHNMINMNINLF